MAALGILPKGGIADWPGPLGLIVHHGLLLFAVVNPIGNIPVYADLTRELEIRERGNVMKLAVLTSLFVVTIFALIGDWSLVHLFNVTVGELEIAGGILLFTVALRGVLSHGPVYQHPKDSRMLAVFPIAFPIMVGPGAITMTIITTGAIGQGLMIITAVITFFFVFLIAWNATRLMRLIGPYAGMMIGRLFYIFLAAKAVAMVLNGVTEFIHGLSGKDPNAVSMLF
ncbi:MAG TPA: MarC family protein [Sedimentisphaerales bacterium]|nr:MarC family protein [Sedimentisphaerales bacterium]